MLKVENDYTFTLPRDLFLSAAPQHPSFLEIFVLSVPATQQAALEVQLTE